MGGGREVGGMKIGGDMFDGNMKLLDGVDEFRIMGVRVGGGDYVGCGYGVGGGRV